MQDDIKLHDDRTLPRSALVRYRGGIGTKPFEQAALVTRVRSLLRTKQLHDTVQQQSMKLKEQIEQLTRRN